MNTKFVTFCIEVNRTRVQNSNQGFVSSHKLKRHKAKINKQRLLTSPKINARKFRKIKTGNKQAKQTPTTNVQTNAKNKL